MPENDKRTTHTRYYVRCARALGLLVFEDVPGKPDEISHPRLPDVASEHIESESPSDEADLALKEDDAPPALGELPATE